MSFFKKFTDGITDDLSRLGIGSDKTERKDEAPQQPAPQQSATRDGVYPPGPPQGYGQHSPQPYPGQYQSPPPHQPDYQSPPPHQSDYSSPPPQDRSQYGYPPEVGPRPPPPYNPPADKPPLPSGWVSRWDERNQRWYCEFLSPTANR
jgi:hypothetical protein